MTTDDDTDEAPAARAFTIDAEMGFDLLSQGDLKDAEERAGFDEGAHPRDPDGTFASGGARAGDRVKVKEGSGRVIATADHERERGLPPGMPLRPVTDVLVQLDDGSTGWVSKDEYQIEKKA